MSFSLDRCELSACRLIGPIRPTGRRHWAAVVLFQAEQHFRQTRANRHLPLLKRALRGDASKLDATEKAQRIG